MGPDGPGSLVREVHAGETLTLLHLDAAPDIDFLKQNLSRKTLRLHVAYVPVRGPK